MGAEGSYELRRKHTGAQSRGVDPPAKQTPGAPAPEWAAEVVAERRPRHPAGLPAPLLPVLTALLASPSTLLCVHSVLVNCQEAKLRRGGWCFSQTFMVLWDAVCLKLKKKTLVPKTAPFSPMPSVFLLLGRQKTKALTHIHLHK